MKNRKNPQKFEGKHPTKMLDLLPLDSDGELGSETVNSSQSSMSNDSCCDRCSSLSRHSDDVSAASASSAAASKPHRSSDPAWTAIRSRTIKSGLNLNLNLGAKDFKLIRRIGSGDIGTVYLCKLRDDSSPENSPSPSPSPALYAMKVVDKDVLRKKKKMGRAETEKRILKVLDHPFLPTLYADFDASPSYSCVVMEFCSGGDLHSLRHRQPAHRFSINAARFYAAEVLLALEYLHMLGIVYRDLKPENVLIRSDGHIMLSDFDLSLESTSSPSLQPVDPTPATEPPTDLPFPSCLPMAFSKPKKAQIQPQTRRFIAEPVDAKSNSFVGTHEYVAPEVASGRHHGSAVDWWAYGVFLYELIHGKTPFVGPNNEATLKNIVKKPLTFPSVSGPVDGLIAGLLRKDPMDRLGSVNGAADVKAHSFFKGVNFALLRSCKPPVVPGLGRVGSCKAEQPKPERFDYF